LVIVVLQSIDEAEVTTASVAVGVAVRLVCLLAAAAALVLTKGKSDLKNENIVFV
jgi:hypothetical protein